MADELTKEEVERRAQELARRVMSTPYQKQEWPKEQKPEREPKPKKGRTKPAS